MEIRSKPTTEGLEAKFCVVVVVTLSQLAVPEMPISISISVLFTGPGPSPCLHLSQPLHTSSHIKIHATSHSAYFQEYRNGQPFIFPWHVLLIPLTIFYRAEMQKELLEKERSVRKQEGQTERDYLFSTLCERYSRSQAASELESCSCGAYKTREGYKYNDHRRGSNFAESIAIQRHNSFMRLARRGIGRPTVRPAARQATSC